MKGEKVQQISIFVFVISLSVLFFCNFVYAYDPNEQLVNSNNGDNHEAVGSPRILPRQVAVSQGDDMNGNSSKSKSGGNTSRSSMIDNMEGSSLSTKAMTLKASGASAGEAAIVLVGKGYDPSEVKTSLIDNGYDAGKVSEAISGLSNNNQNNTQKGTSTDMGTINKAFPINIESAGTPGEGATNVQTGVNTANTETVDQNGVIANQTSNTKTTESSGTSTNQNSSEGTPVVMKNISGALVYDDRKGKADASLLQSLQDSLVKAQDKFQSMGFDKKNVELHITDWDSNNTDTPVEIETGMGKNNTLNLEMRIKPGTSDKDLPDVNMMMTHEYVHIVINDKAGGKSPDTVEGNGVSKGYVNYFGESMGNSTGLLDHDYVLGKDVSSTPTVMDGKDKQTSNAVLSFASALWDLGKQLGKDKVNQMAYDSLSHINGNYTFQNAVNALVTADGGKDTSVINSVMQAHGLPAATI